MKKVIIVTMASLFLMACSDSGGGSSSGSGGGGGSSDGGTGSNPPLVADSPIASDNSEPVKTQDLVAPEGFAFNPVISQALKINLSGSLPERTHLTIYSGFKDKEDGGFIVDYDSKVIDSSISNGEGMIEFSVAESQSSIVAEIWSYDGSDPLQRKFEIDGGDLVWE
ncbi:hypothetical protein [Aliivibrio logei]|jgi:hypothetical protein|uniref:hypothetical protein n=1 Tax=Aliivibrio logei TaxID=688 RepID=UPI0035C8DBE4